MVLCIFVLPAVAQAGIRAAFYYPWFSETWSVNGSHVFYHPQLGYYSSDNGVLVNRHIAWLDFARIQAGIASWFGPGTHGERTRIPLLLNRTRDLHSPLKWTVYYEKEGSGDPSVAEIRSDLSYLSGYASSPSWLRVNSKPVVFVYGNASDTCATADRWKQAAPGWYVQLKLFSGFASCASQPDGWHQYAPSTRLQHHAGYYSSVSPGFWRADEPAPRLARDLNAFRTAVRNMVASNEPWQLVTTFNEWGEGTAVEAASEWSGTCVHPLRTWPYCPGYYLRSLRQNGAVTRLPPLPPPPQLPPTPPPPPPPSGDPVIAAAGDISNPSLGAQRLTSDLLINAGLTNVLTLGDNQYENGTLSDYNAYYNPTWGRVKSITKPTPGNHEYHTSGAAGYFSYYGNPPPYYSFNVGRWHLISLNSEIAHDSSSAQVQWLRGDLAAHTNTCTLAYWHQPRFSSGTTHGSDSSYQPFWDVLSQANADVVLTGHEHNYERFAPQQGIREFVVGTGGRSHYGIGTPIANSEVRNSTAYGVVRLTLHASSYDWKFQPVAGQSFTDSGTQACH